MDSQMVIVDGRFLYDGHRLAWRRGVVVDNPLDSAFVAVEFQPTGRERKAKVQKMPVYWLLRDTPALREKLTIAGILK